MKLCDIRMHKQPNGEKTLRVSLDGRADKVIIAVFAIVILALLVYTGAISPEVFLRAFEKVPALSN